MKISIETQITVEAPPTRIWRILTDFPTMSSWNPFIRSISGALTPGNQLSVQIAPPDRALSCEIRAIRDSALSDC